MGRATLLRKPAASRNEVPELLTVRDMAAMYKLNPQTLYRLARKGMIPSIRIGKSLRFDPIQVRGALAAQRAFPGGAPPARVSARSLAFRPLDELLAQNQWTSPPPDLTLERFAVDFPPGADLMTLAYERERP